MGVLFGALKENVGAGLLVAMLDNLGIFYVGRRGFPKFAFPLGNFN
jgi:hypothetical protein